MKAKKMLTVLVVFTLVGASLLSIPAPVWGDETDGSPIEVTLVNPKENSTITNQTPLIEISFFSQGGINTSSIILIVDKIDVTDFDYTKIKVDGLTYQVTEIFKLSDKNQHNVTISLSDYDGNHIEKTFSFLVDTDYVEQGPGLQEFAIWILVGFGIGGAGFGIAILYLNKTKGFTFRKFFAKHPIPKRLFLMVIPAVAAVLFILFMIAFVLSDPNVTSFAFEYMIIAALFIGLLPYAIYAQMEKKTIAHYERAFSQFLFELADSMRGGIDPSKAVIELSKTDTSILGKHLKIAAKGIEMGRPFEEMIMVMVKSIDSKLVKRYASLVGESAKVGGEISLVVHRAAKDMDDLIKISTERTQSLMGQATTIYISFGVLIIIIYQLIGLYPALGDTSFGLGDTSSSGSKMSIETMKHRFFDLTLILSLGNGALIGLFTSGKVKYGLMHGLLMVLITMILYMMLII